MKFNFTSPYRLLSLVLILSLLFVFVTSSCSVNKSTLLVEVPENEGLDMKEFAVLDKSAIEILKENKDEIFAEILLDLNSKDESKKFHAGRVKKELESDAPDSVKFGNLISKIGMSMAYRNYPKYAVSWVKAFNLIEKHKVQSFSLLENKTYISGLEPKTYYIFGYKETPYLGVIAIWDIQIDIKGGKNKVFLDKNNSIYTYQE